MSDAKELQAKYDTLSAERTQDVKRLQIKEDKITAIQLQLKDAEKDINDYVKVNDKFTQKEQAQQATIDQLQ